MITRKPRRSVVGAPYLLENGISLEGLSEPRLVFSGTARDAAAGFPENVNVAAALSLAGIGPDRTTIEIWADPAIERNCHTIEVDSDSSHFTLAIENVPSENPRTGRITALSVVAALRKLTTPLRVGTCCNPALTGKNAVGLPARARASRPARRDNRVTGSICCRF